MVDIYGALRALLNPGNGRFQRAFLLRRGEPLRVLIAADLDRDGDSDLIALNERLTELRVVKSLTAPPSSRDDDGDATPDECAASLPRFLRGDANQSGSVNITDAVAVLRRFFLGAGEPPCGKALDVNDSGRLEVSDAIHLLGYLFLEGEGIPAPHPACGPDPTRDALSCLSAAACNP